jgi:hypothetical protein
MIMGAGGRDFHDFNVVYRGDPEVEVVAFTAAQIPGIADRVYPAVLAGPRYPDGIPVLPEEDLDELIGRLAVDEVVFAYSDVSHQWVMHIASRVLAAALTSGCSARLRRCLRVGDRWWRCALCARARARARRVGGSGRCCARPA